MNETTGFMFPGLFFHTPIDIAAKFLVEYFRRYWALQLSLKHAFMGVFWTLLYFEPQYFILIG